MKYNKPMDNRLFKTLFVVIIFKISSPLLAQDERFTRKLLSGDLTRVVPIQAESLYKFKARSPYYEIDLNGDFRSESFVIEKKDGEDWLHVYSYKKEKIFSYKLETAGPHSRLYRITSKRLSNITTVYILHFFEGTNGYLKFRSQARFYFLTIDNKKLKSLSVYRGPAYWEEFKSYNHGHYHQRRYKLSAIDLNKDGIKELSLHHNQSNSVYFYLGFGAWQTF